MPARVRAFCAHTGQPEPVEPGAVVRCILESLALKHAQTIDVLAVRHRRRARARSTSSAAARATSCSAAGRRTPPACRCSPGPEEATLLGNLLVQAMALGEIALARGGARGRRALVRADRPTSRRTTSELAGGRESASARRRAPDAGGPRHERARSERSARHPGAGGPLGRRGRRPRRRSTALVYRSNLLGADRALANQGGGNTSSKGTMVDHAGREQRVLWVKGSGTDLASITRPGFAALRLDEILPLRERESMDDAAMVEYLVRCGLAPNQPRPSIETLLHAFIPAAHVDHTHPDAIIALTSSPDGRSLAEETFGDEAVWLDYQRPGFDMSKRIAELLEANPVGARGAAREARPRDVGRDARAELPRHDRVRHARRCARSTAPADGRFGLGGTKVAELGEDDAEALLVAGSSRAPRCAARRRGRRRARGRPQPGGSRVRVVRSARPK